LVDAHLICKELYVEEKAKGKWNQQTVQLKRNDFVAYNTFICYGNDAYKFNTIVDMCLFNSCMCTSGNTNIHTLKCWTFCHHYMAAIKGTKRIKIDLAGSFK